jgi:hypothetical protein
VNVALQQQSAGLAFSVESQREPYVELGINRRMVPDGVIRRTPESPPSEPAAIFVTSDPLRIRSQQKRALLNSLIVFQTIGRV